MESSLKTFSNYSLFHLFWVNSFSPLLSTIRINALPIRWFCKTRVANYSLPNTKQSWKFCYFDGQVLSSINEFNTCEKDFFSMRKFNPLTNFKKLILQFYTFENKACVFFHCIHLEENTSYRTPMSWFSFLYIWEWSSVFFHCIIYWEEDTQFVHNSNFLVFISIHLGKKSFSLYNILRRKFQFLSPLFEPQEP